LLKNISFDIIYKAESLPSDWDFGAVNYYLKIKFLKHAEEYNPCKQRYYLCYKNNKLVSGAVVYSLRLDMFTFLKIKSPIKMNIVGVPCSVSSQGIFGDNESISYLKKYIFKKEKGIVLFLNLKNIPETDNAWGKTLPSVIMTNRFRSVDDYLLALRSEYRRRLKLINKSSDKLIFEKKTCLEFDDSMYKLYLNVYKRSNGKLEKLTCDFFKNLPSEFILTICSLQKKVIGWNIALHYDNTYYFFMGGTDYSFNSKYNTYLRLLFLLINDGIINKSEFIDLGQTAEIPKMRFGGKILPLYMEAKHNNFLFNQLLKYGKGFMEYKYPKEQSKPFKEV